MGCGRIGSVHLSYLPAIHNVSLVAIVDTNPQVRASLRDRTSTLSFASFAESLISLKLYNQLPDAVMICTPTETHFELIKLALSSGLAVFCEKPIATKIHQIDELYELSMRLNLPLLCGFQRRFDPTFSRLKQEIDSNTIGQIHLLHTSSRDHPLPPVEFLRHSSGIFHDCGSHDIDVHRWLLEEEPIEIYATASANMRTIREINDYDTAFVVMKYASGCISTFDLHRYATYGYDQRIEVMGSEGKLMAENPTRTSLVIANAKGHTRDTCFHSFNDRYVDAYRNGTLAFIAVVLGQQQSKIQHQDVRQCLIIAQACETSARTGKPIKL